MNIATVAKIVKFSAKNSVKLIEKNLPLILQTGGIVGMIGGTIMAAKATPKANEVIQKYREDHKDDNCSKVRKVVNEVITVGPYYIPTIIVEGASIASLIMSYRINMKRIMALGAALSLSEDKLRVFQDKAKEVLGEETVDKINEEIAKDDLDNMDVVNKMIPQDLLNDILEVAGGTVLCLDQVTGRLFYSNRTYIETRLNELNSKLRDEMYVTINEWYDILGLHHCDSGDVLGFISDDYGRGGVKFDFYSELTHGGETPLLVMRYDYSSDVRRRY